MAAGGVRMTANVDSDEGARQASDAADAAGVTMHLQIDVDTGMHRGGIPEDGGRARRVAGARDRAASRRGVRRAHHAPLVRVRGEARACEEEGHHEGEVVVDIAERLRAAGVEVREVSAGSSFTGKYVAEVPGITESRAGTYVFFDLTHLYEGSCTEDQLALSALCRVNSLWGEGGLTIDGGTKTFSSDRAPAAADGRCRRWRRPPGARCSSSA